MKANYKLVLDFMGYHVEDDYENPLHIKDSQGQWVVDGREWNPETDRNCWPEIWGKLKSVELDEYHDMSDVYYTNLGNPSFWELHAATTETCWKALIKTIKDTP